VKTFKFISMLLCCAMAFIVGTAFLSLMTRDITAVNTDGFSRAAVVALSAIGAVVSYIACAAYAVSAYRTVSKKETRK